MKERLQARITQITEGESSRIGATIDLGAAITTPDARERLSKLEQEYAKMLEQVRRLKQAQTNVVSKWRIADTIFEFLEKVRKWNIELESHLRTLCRDTGISRTEMKYLLRFRKTYAFSELDANVNWSTYRRLLYSEAPYGKTKPRKQ